MAGEESRSKDEPLLSDKLSLLFIIYLASFMRKIGVCLCFDDVSLCEFLRHLGEKGGEFDLFYSLVAHQAS